MKIDMKTGSVACKCTKCGGSFTIGASAFLHAPISVKTTCPKCRGVQPKKKGGKRK